MEPYTLAGTAPLLEWLNDDDPPPTRQQRDAVELFLLDDLPANPNWPATPIPGEVFPVVVVFLPCDVAVDYWVDHPKRLIHLKKIKSLHQGWPLV